MFKFVFLISTFFLILNKNSAEVDIAPALGEITRVCNVGQVKLGHGACMKSMSRTNTMQGFILTATEKCRLDINFDKVNGARNEGKGHRVMVHA